MTGYGVAKLVRDKVPALIRRSGLEPVIRVADGDEYKQLLREKLREEVEEFLESNDPHELADILEVLHALVLDLGLDRDGLEQLRVDKADARGGFVNRIVWLGNDRGQSDDQGDDECLTNS